MPKAPSTPAKPRRQTAKNGVTNDKLDLLEPFRERPDGTTLTTDQGGLVVDTDNSLTAGERGPTLLEDFHLREKITRFDHERIPERVVHARGAAAHGFFQAYEGLDGLTKAQFLLDPSRKTPVFVRFSTVGGSRGSADTARDVRGFAVKFYTEEGNYDLVGNNIPVFFIQDGIKFPDFVHAVKPEPHREIPQASSAHDSFYDFISLVPESAHMLMWLMSDRAIPRSYRMMEGFGVHTFRLVNDAGKSTFVKFHWKPLLGTHGLAWDESQQLAGRDPDFHRRDLWDAIEAGAFPEWELGIQTVTEAQAAKLPFDLLDPTKLIPEELFPVQRIGKMTLNRNPDNYFAETEQVAFCVANIVPGIDFTADRLLQARIFSYLDTQITRLGGPNHAEIPINRPLAPIHNHQQDGFHRQTIPTSRVNYFPNSLGGGCPMRAGPKEGFVHFPEPLGGPALRKRPESFADHFSQATLFFRSLTPPEQQHLISALQFELAKVEMPAIRERMVNDILARIDERLAKEVALALGLTVKAGAPKPSTGKLAPSPALSMELGPKGDISSRKIALLVTDGADLAGVAELKAALTAEGAALEVVGPMLGELKGAGGKTLPVDRSMPTAPSLMYDGVVLVGGAENLVKLGQSWDAKRFVREAYQHSKTIGLFGEAQEFLTKARGEHAGDVAGVVKSPALDKASIKAFITALGNHRHWAREAPSPERPGALLPAK